MIWHRHRWSQQIVTLGTWPLHHGTVEVRCTVCGKRRSMNPIGTGWVAWTLWEWSG